MKKTLVILFFLAATVICRGQNEAAWCNDQYRPLTKDSSTLFRQHAKVTSQITGKYFLKIYYHIIRKSDHTGGRTLSDVYSSLDGLKSVFNPHGICISYCGYDYIGNDYWFYEDISALGGFLNYTLKHTNPFLMRLTFTFPI